jgi:hypothetical protein
MPDRTTRPLFISKAVFAVLFNALLPFISPTPVHAAPPSPCPGLVPTQTNNMAFGSDYSGTGGNDVILNNDTISGRLLGGAGNDCIVNASGATITNSIIGGAGAVFPGEYVALSRSRSILSRL